MRTCTTTTHTHSKTHAHPLSHTTTPRKQPTRHNGTHACVRSSSPARASRPSPHLISPTHPTISLTPLSLVTTRISAAHYATSRDALGALDCSPLLVLRVAGAEANKPTRSGHASTRTGLRSKPKRAGSGKREQRARAASVCRVRADVMAAGRGGEAAVRIRARARDGELRLTIGLGLGLRLGLRHTRRGRRAPKPSALALELGSASHAQQETAASGPLTQRRFEPTRPIRLTIHARTRWSPPRASAAPPAHAWWKRFEQ